MNTKLVRHLLGTLSYRATVALKGAPSHFPEFQVGKGVKTPVELLAHMSDVLTTAYSWFENIERSNQVRSWAEEVNRFYDLLEKLDHAIADNLPMEASQEQLLQGPLADTLTHVGQLLMLRRLADSPVQKVSYIQADIQIGDIDQSNLRTSLTSKE